MCLQITCSSNLHGTDVSNTGLLFSGAYLSPFFNIRDTLAFNQSRGSVPVSMDFWYILVSPGASCLAHSFNILFGMLFGLEALEGFIFLSNFSIPSDRISRSGIDLLTCMSMCFVVFGSVLFSSLVNTEKIGLSVCLPSPYCHLPVVHYFSVMILRCYLVFEI